MVQNIQNFILEDPPSADWETLYGKARIYERDHYITYGGGPEGAYVFFLPRPGTSGELADPAVFKDAFYVFLVSPPRGGPREGPNYHLPKQIEGFGLVPARIRGLYSFNCHFGPQHSWEGFRFPEIWAPSLQKPWAFIACRTFGWSLESGNTKTCSRNGFRIGRRADFRGI
jgi:hypothetical protein